jgi:hypothetical protein
MENHMSDFRTCADGSIDFDFYRRQAGYERRTVMRRAIRKAWSLRWLSSLNLAWPVDFEPASLKPPAEAHLRR